MWFKNLFVYRYAGDWSIKADDFEACLSENALQPCASFAMESRGWVQPGKEQRFLYTMQRHWLFAQGVDQKLLPSTIVRQVAEDRAADLAQKLAHPIGRKQMRDLRLQVTDELLPKALTRRRKTHAWIDTVGGWLIIDLAADGKADELMEALRKACDELPPVRHLETAKSPGAMMTHWVESGDAPANFSIDMDLELQSADSSKQIVRYVHHPLDGRDIQAHIKSGKVATRLGMTWKDRISFVLTDKLQIKRITFQDILKNEGENDQTAQSEEEKFDIDFALMTGELSQCLDDLVEALGGMSAH